MNERQESGEHEHSGIDRLWVWPAISSLCANPGSRSVRIFDDLI
jgi:hypothetical protein